MSLFIARDATDCREVTKKEFGEFILNLCEMLNVNKKFNFIFRGLTMNMQKGRA